MKKIYSKILACILIALLAVSAISMVMPVKASTASTLSYYEMSFSFTGGTSVARGFDGTFLTIRLMATADNGRSERVTLSVYVTNTGKTHTYTFETDGLTYEFKNIYLSLKGGSDVRFAFSADNKDVKININMTAES